MTKEQLIYLAMTHLGQGDLTPRQKSLIHRGDIERHLEMAFSDIVREVYNNSVTHKDYGLLDAMAKSYPDVLVAMDKTRGEKYSYLPITIIQLPLHAGIRMVHTQCDQSEQVHWRPNNNIGILNQLEVFTTGKDLPTYYVEHGKLYYDRMKSDNVTMKLIPSFSSYEDDDEVPVVSGYEGWVFDMVSQRYTQGSARPNKVKETS